MKKSLPLRANSPEGALIRDALATGVVPFCVRDAFSWLPHPYGNIGTRKHPNFVWGWNHGHGDERDRVPDKQPCGKRCANCVFQEPAWSQGHAACSMSWLHDDDGDCRAFLARADILAEHPHLENCCVPLHPFDAQIPDEARERMSNEPYWSDGTTFAEFKPSCNFPSEYYAMLNWREWYQNGGWQLYEPAQRERLRRLEQYADDLELQKRGFRQLDLPIEMYIAQQQNAGRVMPQSKPADATPRERVKSPRRKLKQLELL